MKKLFLACAIIGCSLAMPKAFAQDYCCPPQYDSCCGDSFDGFYIGGNLGVFSHVAHRNDLDQFLTDASGWSTIDTSFTAGLQLGYDWQCCNKLVGLVVDWNWVDTDHRVRDGVSTGNDNFAHSEAHWFTTIRGRFGLAVCDALVYVTGGAVVTRFENRWNNAPNLFSHRHARWGWTGGVGTELLLGCNWSLGAEILYLHFSHHTRNFTSVDGDPFAFGHSDSGYVGRILLNYRFGDFFCCN